MKDRPTPRVVECVVLFPGGLERAMSNICDAQEKRDSGKKKPVGKVRKSVLPLSKS